MSISDDQPQTATVENSHITATLRLTERDILDDLLRLPRRAANALVVDRMLRVDMIHHQQHHRNHALRVRGELQGDGSLILREVVWPLEMRAGQIVEVSLLDTDHGTCRVGVYFDAH